MEKFSRYLTPTPFEEEIPERAIFIDTETRISETDGNKDKLELLVACYEVWVVDENGIGVKMIESGVINHEPEFYHLIKSYMPCRVVAHNWRFDATVLRIGAKDNLVNHNYDIDVSESIIPVEAKGFTPFLISLNFDGDSVELICNTNFYKQSLASLGDSFGTDKYEMPTEDEYDDYDEYLADLITYCARDVEVLRKSYFFLFEFSQEIGNVTPSSTIAQTANRVYRTTFMPNLKIQGSLGIPYISDIEQDAYRGGRTDAFFKGNPNTKIYKYDVNSLYPYSMLGNIPIRYVQAVPNDMVGKSDRYLYLIDATIKIDITDKHSFLGGEGIKTDKGELIFPIGEYRCWIWQPMFETLNSRGYIADIHKVYAYNKAPIFDDYVTRLYTLREGYKRSKDMARDLLVKILLNSLYGKFGQREHSKWEMVDDYQRDVMMRDAVGIERFEEVFEGVYTEYLQIGETIYASTPLKHAEPTLNSVMSIAGYITSKARSVLWETMAYILDRGGEIYYCDTDSIFTSMELPDDMVSQTELGKWKLEEVIPKGEAEFIAPKHYRVSDKWTIKGIRNPSGSDKHDQTLFPNFITDLTSKNPLRRERLESGAIITRIIKEPTGINNKRVSNSDNSPTFPLVMS